MKIANLILCVLIASVSLIANAQLAPPSDYQSLPELQALAERYVHDSVSSKTGELQVKAEALDPRLHLARCGDKPEAFLPSGANLASRTTVGVRCNSQSIQWTLYIGVNLETQTPVLVLNRAVARDTQLSSSDVTVDVRRVPGLSSGYLTDVAQLKDCSARQNLSAGMVLTPTMLQPAVLIHRGQQVTVLASASGISVRAEAIALTDGAIKSRIRVRNVSTAKEVEGVVDSSSVVRVEL